MSGKTAKHCAAREMGSQGVRGTGGGLARVPNLPCVRAPFSSGVAHAGRGGRRGEGRSNVLPWYRLVGAVSTSSQTHKRGKAGLPVKRVSGRHVVRGRQSSPIPAQQPAVNCGSKGVHQGNRQG